MAENKKRKQEQVAINEEEFAKVQKEINDCLLKEKKEKEKKLKNNSTYLFLSFFIKRLKEDKLYLFSFIITLVFLSIFSVTKLKATEGYYDKKNENNIGENNVTPTINTNLNASETKKDETASEELNVTDYIGIYSKEEILASPIVINETCSLTDYKIIYQIKKDKSITKYFMSDCIGTIKIWDDKLNYVSSGGARYISANKINFLFSSSNMKEVDGETYKIDEDITNIKINSKQKDIDILFNENNIILRTKKDLVLLKGATISFQLTERYKTNNLLDQIIYKSSTENQFRFIIYNEKETKTCYKKEEIENQNFKDEEIYKIFSIEYDLEQENFSEEKEIISRKKSDGCKLYEEDMKTLKE